MLALDLEIIQQLGNAVSAVAFVVEHILLDAMMP